MAGYPEVRESEIQASIISYLRYAGWVVLEIRGNAQRGGPVFQTKGIPDLYAVRRGRQIWFEVKRPKGRLSPEQVKLHELLRDEGAEVHVVYSLDDVIKVITDTHGHSE